MTQPLTISQQARILKSALERGLIRPAELGLSPRGDSETLSEADLAARFQELLDAGRLQGVVDEAFGADTDATLAPGPPPLSRTPSGAYESVLLPEERALFPLPLDGRYLPLAFLGDGGMGAVYKAFDQQLKRIVALKFPKRLGQGQAERFLQEGRAQARIEHPNVCQIYSVDEHQGQPYLSMRFIAGPTLKEAIGRLSLEQQVHIVREVALALHACHRLGIIHRDVKPGNIMLEAQEDGAWRPCLMDFGVAQEQGEGAEALPGVLFGTPAYCSPEQAEGHLGGVDRRSDVYALGATLYTCLSGHPPFSPALPLPELVRQIVEEEPAPLGPPVPRDLARVVRKALEKDPARRYDSARALAEDLQRFLDGDPVLADGAGLGYRLVKCYRKNRALAWVAAVSLLAVVTFAAFGVAMAFRARAMSQAYQKYGREAEYLEDILNRSYTLPLHDVTEERARVQERLDQILASLGHLGRWTLPAARVALGRGYLALDRLEEARKELEAGAGRLPQDPDTALALGLTLSRLYQGELEGLRGQVLLDKKKDTEQDLRQPALACLRRARGARQDGPDYVEAVLALVEERYGDAIAKAQAYHRAAPWSYEAWLLEAEAHQALAALRLGEGRFEDAEVRLEEAGKALAQARNVARSAPLAYQGEVQRRLLTYQLRLDRGRATQADRDWALEAVDLCLQANPRDWKALGYRAAIHRRWGAHLLNRGQDPTASLDAAIAAAQEGLAWRPQDNPLWNNLGTCLRNRADWEASQGLDPRPTLARAVAALSRALDRPQFKDWLLDSIGCCHGQEAKYQLDHGQDPTEAARRAVACLTQASALKPWVGHDTTRGATLVDLALYQAMTGQDPAAAFAEARQAFRAGLHLNPRSYQAQAGLAQMLAERAEWALGAGRPPGGDLPEALDHLQAALALNPGLGATVFPALARCRALEALARPETRAASLRAAREALAQARPFAQEPGTALALAHAGWLLSRADPASGAAAQALATLRPALARRAWDAQVHLTQGRLLQALGRRPEAAAAFARAQALNPNLGRRGM
ncbi:serine/threonine-protein kinase [Mesoterricola sediminis]|uniref:Protein kinase domain-containing protein n=1 Tax=Mesoterricola sediminis TaxID=2927980 RepID=A0AA48GSS5_9BACT|nr:serine/threonine-protein kinase [Mesoterricola sediminis]BDU77004.1 hypothetical protein METESE_19620 [Mesoterricola sediminis]